MFELEKELDYWVDSLKHKGINDKFDLYELREHLSLSVEEGSNDKDSLRYTFESAVKKIGDPNALLREFEKNKDARQHSPLKAVLIGFLIAYIGPALALLLVVLPYLIQLEEGVAQESITSYIFSNNRILLWSLITNIFFCGLAGYTIGGYLQKNNYRIILKVIIGFFIFDFLRIFLVAEAATASSWYIYSLLMFWPIAMFYGTHLRYKKQVLRLG